MAWLIWRPLEKKKSGFIPVGFKIYQMLIKYFETVDIVCVARRHQTFEHSCLARESKKVQLLPSRVQIFVYHEEKI
jgi:hypothetical protein